MPLVWNRQVLAAKIEAAVGTAETLAATDGDDNIRNLEVNANIEFENRQGQGASFDPIAGVPGARGIEFTFDVDLFGGVAVPEWAAKYLPACGFGNTAGVFNRDSRPPEAASSGSKSLTIGAYKDGILYRGLGCMGNCVMTFRAGFVATAAFRFMGVYFEDPTATALIAPTYPTTSPLRFDAAGLTIGSFVPRLNNLTLDFGNELYLRPFQGSTNGSGYHSCVIVNGGARLTLDPESTVPGAHGAAVYSPHEDWVDRVERAVGWSLGAPGNRIAISMPKVQLANVQKLNRGGLVCDQIEAIAKRDAAGGEDALTITID